MKTGSFSKKAILNSHAIMLSIDQQNPVNENDRTNLLNNYQNSSSSSDTQETSRAAFSPFLKSARKKFIELHASIKKRKYSIAISIFVSSLFISVCSIFIPCNNYNYHSAKSVEGTYPTKEPFSNATINVAMIGDSQIHFPCLTYDMIGKLHQHLPEYKLAFADYADYGRSIKDVNSSLEEVLLLKPDAYFLYWDTEVFRFTDWELSKRQIKEMRAEYRANLISVIKSILATGAYLAVMGPGVLGEGPGIFLPRRFWFKKQMISDYVSMNKDICNEYGVDYIGNYAKSCTLHAHYLSLLCSV